MIAILWKVGLDTLYTMLGIAIGVYFFNGQLEIAGLFLIILFIVIIIEVAVIIKRERVKPQWSSR